MPKLMSTGLEMKLFVDSCTRQVNLFG